jgi:hypothetical protein
VIDRLDLGPVGVLYEERNRRPPAERADLVSLGEVLEEGAAPSPVLPVRFGTTLPDLAGLEQLMRERGSGWRRRLDAVEGHVEIVVHARDAGGPAPAPDPGAGEVTGTEYLLSRAAAVRHEAELVASVTAAIDPLVAELRVLRGQRETRLACLVPPERVAELREALQAWAEVDEGRSVEATGPWPPFSFAEAEVPA